MAISVHISLLYLSEDLFVAALERLVTSHEVGVKSDRLGTLRKYRFRLEAIDISYDEAVGMASFSGLSPRVVSCLEKYIRVTGAGLRATRFMEFISFEFDGDSHRQKVTEDFMRMVAAAPNGIKSSVNNLHGSRSVATVKQGRHTFSSICSAMMHSRGVEHWTSDDIFGTSDEDRFDKWYWFMYAMFHASATHSITSLEIREESLPLKDVEQVEYVVVGNPRILNDIYSAALDLLARGSIGDSGSGDELDTTEQIAPGSSVIVKVGAAIYLEAMRGGGGSKHVLATSSVTPYVVIYAKGDTIAIFVPGYGKCWVDKSDIVTELPSPYDIASPETQWKLKTHGITQLSIRFNDEPTDSQAGTLALLKLIGEPLKTLAIQYPRYDPWDDAELDKLWEYCPNLTELCLGNFRASSLDLFVDAYASGECHLTSLELFHCVWSKHQSVLSFAEALGDPSTNLSKTLQQFRFRLEEDDVWSVDSDGELEDFDEKEIVPAFLSALQTNKRLLFFELHVSHSVYDTYHQDFDHFNGQYLNLVRHPLPTRSKCAFLSVVKIKAQANDQTVGSLDRLVLSLIFHMASEPERRSVIFADRYASNMTFEARDLTY